MFLLAQLDPEKNICPTQNEDGLFLYYCSTG